MNNKLYNIINKLEEDIKILFKLYYYKYQCYNIELSKFIIIYLKKYRCLSLEYYLIMNNIFSEKDKLNELIIENFNYLNINIQNKYLQKYINHLKYNIKIIKEFINNNNKI